MTETIYQSIPASYYDIEKATKESGFSMASDVLTCSLLRTLASSKPSGSFLELGTGTGLSTSWILDGMDHNSRLISLDNDEKVLAIAKKYLGEDKRLTLVHANGEDWVLKTRERNLITFCRHLAWQIPSFRRSPGYATH